MPRLTNFKALAFPLTLALLFHWPASTSGAAVISGSVSPSPPPSPDAGLGTNGGANKCAPNTFHCKKENSCVPIDWLADGESDCEDGEDEGENAKRVAAEFKTGQHNNRAEAEAEGDAGARKSDSFARDASTVLFNSEPLSSATAAAGSVSVSSTPPQARTPPPITPSPVTETSPPPSETTVASVECTRDMPNADQQCSSALNNWIGRLGTFNTSGTIFRHVPSIEIIQSGCKLTSEYAACATAIPEKCRTASRQPPLGEWFSLRTYVCELIVPSVREHIGCFGALRRPSDCPPLLPESASSPMCALLSKAQADIKCVEEHHSVECSEAAMELIPPMRSETQHHIGELSCPAISASPSVSTTSAPEVEEPSTRATPELVHPTTSTAPPQPDVPPQMTNPLYAFSSVDSICPIGRDPPPASNDQFSPIRSKICVNRDPLASNTDCFMGAAKRTESACINSTVSPTGTSCSAINQFNKNVDCVLRLLEELCPTEIYEIVTEVREKLNDEAIAHRCYQQPHQQNASSNTSARINDDGFSLSPSHQRCNSDQENAALICLTELVEVNKRLAQLQSQNLLLELSDRNSSFVSFICELYEKYEGCLNSNVFSRTADHGQRCAFNSPVNTLARVGLAPMCSSKSRQVLADSRPCLLEIAKQPRLSNCQHGLQNIGHIVNLMLQGIHGEALLCKAFYILREAFQCGERAAQQQCASLPVATNLVQIRSQLEDIGREEGCPTDQPPKLDEIIAKPVATATSQQRQPIASGSRPVPPMAKAIPGVPATPEHSGSGGPTGVPVPSVASTAPCEPEEQRRFGDCVQPLTAYQPHPLAVIKQPRQIDEACQAFKNFTACRADVKCNPLWAQGMSAMFNYACSDGYTRYEAVKQCIRRTTARQDIRDCVVTFSKGQPSEACQSSIELLKCAIPPISESCGQEAVEFTDEYVRRFAVAIDPGCKMGEALVKPVSALNCSKEEDQLVQQCATPLNEIHARLDELFEGGLQNFIKNMNSLAPVFAQGCNLTTEFRECTKGVLRNNHTSCVISSCLMKAGEGICDQPDVAGAIETNLGCVFKQVSDESFGRCLRSTIGTLKVFNLRALKEVLPKFVECVEPIVLQMCGAVPINVLRALGSKSVCAVSSTRPTPLKAVVKEKPSCTAEVFELYDRCQRPFYTKYDFMPGALVNQTDISVDEMCGDVGNLLTCWERSKLCEPAGKQRALRKLYSRICSTNKHAFSQRRECLNRVATSTNGHKCIADAMEAVAAAGAANNATCSFMNSTASCLAVDIFAECPPETVSFVYEFTNDYLRELEEGRCPPLRAPTVPLNTGCSEQQLVEHLECEQAVDKYHFQPVAIINDSLKWDEFCKVMQQRYRPCVEKLPCRFEPATTSYLALFEAVCEKEVYHRDQLRFAGCLAEYTASEEGKSCIEPFSSVDVLAKNVASTICGVVNGILSCSAKRVNEKCGDEALLHVYDVHNTWMHAFNSSCVLHPPDLHGVQLGVVPTPRSTDGQGRTEEEKATVKVDAANEEDAAATADGTTDSTTVTSATHHHRQHHQHGEEESTTVASSQAPEQPPTTTEPEEHKTPSISTSGGPTTTTTTTTPKGNGASRGDFAWHRNIISPLLLLMSLCFARHA